MGYVIGNPTNDAAEIGRRGWVVGKFLIHPGTTNNTVVDVLEDVEGITVKASSDPYAKQVLA